MILWELIDYLNISVNPFTSVDIDTDSYQLIRYLILIAETRCRRSKHG
jgi:hypothetical protein